MVVSPIVPGAISGRNERSRKICTDNFFMYVSQYTERETRSNGISIPSAWGNSLGKRGNKGRSLGIPRLYCLITYSDSSPLGE